MRTIKNISFFTCVIFLLISCSETIEIQPMPSPWITFQKSGGANENYIYTNDTIVKRFYSGQTSWRGGIAATVMAPAGIQEVIITKNGEIVPLVDWQTDRVSYEFVQYIEISLTDNNEVCNIKITATDLKGQESSQDVKITYNWW